MWENRWELLAAGPPQAREGVVKARLSILMAALGEHPGQHGPVAPRAGQGLTRLIDAMCPAGTVVVHAKSLSGCSLALEHLVVAPRGVVVVSPDWAPVVPGTARPTTSKPVVAVRPSDQQLRAEANRRSRLVRETLRRAKALRTWLAGTDWAATPVWAALCTAPVLGPPMAPPVVLDGLWVGDVERLPSWLACGVELDTAARQELGSFLVAELPGA
jgi:hypothetical protein